MRKCYLGIDVGSFSIKGVIIDNDNKIIASNYFNISGNYESDIRKLIYKLKKQINLNEYEIDGVGATGSLRKKVGTIINGSIVKNEIIANVVGARTFVPNVRIIFEIGEYDSKIILLKDGKIIDYSMNCLSSAYIGSFISEQSKKLEISVEDFGELALFGKYPMFIDVSCFVVNDFDVIQKIQEGYKKEDIIYGICKLVVSIYLSNFIKNKKVKGPIVFLGGVSKNMGVVRALNEMIGEKVIVNCNSHLMGAFGVAIIAKENKNSCNFEESLYYNFCNNCEIS